jgi:hypothetical protein
VKFEFYIKNETKDHQKAKKVPNQFLPSFVVVYFNQAEYTENFVEIGPIRKKS